MAKSEPTLFEKLETESEKETQEELVTSGEGWRYLMPVRFGIIAATVLLTTLFFPFNRSEFQQVRLGAEWQRETIVAESTFPIYKSKPTYDDEVRIAREQTPPVFTIRMEQESPALRQVQVIIAASAAGQEIPEAAQLQRTIGSSAENLARLTALPKAKQLQKLRHIVGRLTTLHTEAYRRGWINVAKSSLGVPEIVVRRSPTTEQVLNAADVLDSAAFRAEFDRLVREEFDDVESALALDILPKLFLPNLQFSSSLTDEERRHAVESVPKTLGLVRKGETIITNGEIISEQTLNKLQSSEYTRFLYYSQHETLTAFAANLLHAALIYSLLVVYLYIIRKRLFYDNAQLAGLSVSFLFVGLLSWIVNVVQSPLPLQYFVMIPTVSMLLAIVYDSRTTSITTITFALLTAAIRGRDYDVALAMVLAGTFAAYTVRDLRSRTQLFRSMGFIAIAYGVSAVMCAIAYNTPLTLLGLQLGFGAVSAVLSPVLTFGALFLIERAFNITSDLRLIEYDNINHPLLTELNEKAPGTYQHTLMVARLAESAALAIEANAILVKVGALFHDIGKMRKAEYFVENQINVPNKHDRITPGKSAAIIRQHVSEGMLLSVHYKLPQRIADFIPMHHGTMLIRYFYTKALDEAMDKGADASTIDEDDFRYPGPRPNSKETGILMLADAVEAMSHVIDTNDRDELEEAIKEIVRERINDHQLDECDLTLKEIVLIKESFVKNLLGTGHQRVKYKPLPNLAPNTNLRTPAHEGETLSEALAETTTALPATIQTEPFA
jgi:cyclic-di-AMP phosphodiesterase PgpH